jgi:uncharacterized protein YbaA (DUF1428 family)
MAATPEHRHPVTPIRLADRRMRCGCASTSDDVPYGEVMAFPRSLNLKDDEAVVFAWIEYESRARRDSVKERSCKTGG